ncbi:MAG: transglutaminase domain-containing protein [Gudongella sp.]|nr:transglutaminase domain-containing protein [Gudongella sp.]
MREQFALIRKILIVSVVIIMLMSLLINTDGDLTMAGMTDLINRMINKPIVGTEVAELSKNVNSNLPKDIMIHKVEQPSTQIEYEAEFLDMLDAREFNRSFNYFGKKKNKTFDEDYPVITDALYSISSKHPEYMGYIDELNTTIESNGFLSEVTIVLIPRATSGNNKSIDEMLDAFELQAINVMDKLKNEGKISETQTEKQKARALYTWVVQNTKYKNENSVETSSGYGQIINGEAVCQGYVSSYNYLLRLAGIENVVGISGEVDGQPHIWTEAILDGKRTIIDVTFGDPMPDRGDKVDYKYFDISEIEMRKTHTW